MGGKLVLAIQSKGRLAEQTHDYLKSCGIPISGGSGREYVGHMPAVPDVEIAFLQSGEIPTYLESGAVHLGITGEDLMREKTLDLETCMMLLKPLGFGKADLVVAVPRSWIDVHSMADLDEVSTAFHRRHGRRLRVATKYLTLTRDFFAQHGVADYRIVESLGATEGAPNSGAAEAIVDITSTGTTLVANNLKILNDGVILRSQACLAASRNAVWDDAAKTALRRILDMIEGSARADAERLVHFVTPSDEAAMAGAMAALQGKFGCQVALSGRQGSLQCGADKLYPVVSALHAAGCSQVSAAQADYIFAPENALYERFIAALG
ncbi:MAG TPA: ATP phosphoribosyltransferase [Alphaproteobacteria bacterium]|nr:ATP phosphoribosyltransferase [Alphaproteobacteria bacterium]